MLDIFAAKSNAGAYVNRIGKYLKQNLDGAYKIQFNPMECEVFMEMLFEIPDQRDTYGEIRFLISIVSYQNKLRINLTEITEAEKTVGQIILTDADLESMSDFLPIRQKIVKYINKFLKKEYPEYYLVY